MATKKALQAKSASQAEALSAQFKKGGYSGTARKTASRLAETNKALSKMSRAKQRQLATKRKGVKLTSQDTRKRSSVGRDASNATNSAGMIAGSKSNSKAVSGARATKKRSDNVVSENNKNFRNGKGGVKFIKKSASKGTVFSVRAGQSYKTQSGKTYTPSRTKNYKSARALKVATILGKGEFYKVPKSATRSAGGLSKSKLANVSKLVGQRRAKG